MIRFLTWLISLHPEVFEVKVYFHKDVYMTQSEPHEVNYVHSN